MEVEDEDQTLAKLFFKKFGYALPAMPPKRSEVDDIDMNLIDLTNEPDEMEVPTPAPVVVVVKTEPIEIADLDMPEDKSVEQVNSVKQVISVESVESVERKDMTDAELEAEQREFDAKFGHIDYVPDDFDNE